MSRRRCTTPPDSPPASSSTGSSPSPGGAPPPPTLAGVAGVGLGLVLNVAGVAAVIRHRTTIVPHHPVATLLTGGAYRRSRNPMYTGLAIAYLGLAVLLGSW